MDNERLLETWIFGINRSAWVGVDYEERMNTTGNVSNSAILQHVVDF